MRPTLIASIMYWSLIHPSLDEHEPCVSSGSENESLLETSSSSAIEYTASESSIDDTAIE